MVTSTQTTEVVRIVPPFVSDSHSHKGLATRYDAAASTWDDTLRKLRMPQVYKHLFEDIAHRNLLPGHVQHVLDIGIGTGALSGALLDVRPGVRELTGFDISTCMLEEAHHNLANAGARVRMQQQDVSQWQAPHEVYDMVISAHTLEHLNDPAIAIDQIFRSLRPGGTFVLMMTRQSLWGRYIRYQWNDVSPTCPHTVSTWLEQAGFGSVTQMRLRGNFISGAGSLAMVGCKPG
ncbi:MAG: class I SAM-dependent methyltransferase [Chloroflexota bacterium]